MKQILMVVTMVLLQGMAMAGNRIRGIVLDDSNASPLIGATVVLSDEEGCQVMGVTTDANGRFEMKEVESSNYILQCSYVGYDTFTIVLKLLDDHTDLGEVRLKPTSALLDEVVIEGEKVIQKIDRRLVMPTEDQKKASTNGVSLLQHLQLPNISVNVLDKSIQTNYGEMVQLRINGVKATQAEVIAICPADVIRVEYHEQPGLRYGGAPAVVDYIIRRREAGGNISADLMNGVSHFGVGQYQLSGKYHRGRSAFSTVVQWSRRDLEWFRENEETFCYPNRTITNREEAASPTQVKYDYLNFALNYNYVDNEKSMLNVALRNDTKNIPHSFTDRNSLLYQEEKVYEVKDHEHSKINIPSLDVYYQLNLKKDQHLYLDVVGTYLSSSNQRNYSLTEQGELPQEIFSRTEGDKYSLIGEAIYERPLFGGKFTAGIKHHYARMDNVYDGNVFTEVSMNTAETSLFTEYQSKIKKLSYTLGLGVMRTNYKQGDAMQEKYIFRPTLNLSYPLGNLYLRYNASLSGYAPSLSVLSDVEQNMDVYQVHRGNPELKSVTYFTNRLSVGFRRNWINMEVSARYRYENNPIMEETFYEEGKFIRTYANQRGFHRLNLRADFQFQPFKQYLSINLNPYFNRYISQGYDYVHTHSNWGFNGSIVGMYKHWVVMAEIHTSFHELFGETIQKSESFHSVALGYNKKRWALQAMVMNPFSKDYRQGKENLSELAPNRQKAYTSDLSPVFVLNVSFRLDFGKQKQIMKKRIQNEDTDTGILSGSK